MTTIDIYVRDADGAEKLVGTVKAEPGTFELLPSRNGDDE